MAIENIVDPRTRKNITLITGKIEGMYFNELKEIKTYTSGKAPWTPTHSINIVVDGTRIGMGLSDKQEINSKDVEGKYHKLARGMEVSVEVSQITQWQGKDQYNSKASLITVIDISEAEAPSTGNANAGGNKTFKKRDNKGVIAGNARTAATNWAAKEGGSIEQYLGTFAKLAHDKRASYAASNTNLDDFEVGVTVGQAVIAASQLAKGVSSLDAFVDHYLNTVVPDSLTIIENLQAGRTQRTPQKAPKREEVIIQEPVGGLHDIKDDDIPF